MLLPIQIDGSIIQTVKDHGNILPFHHFFVHNTGVVSRPEISVDRPNTTRDNVKRGLRVCLNKQRFFFFSVRAKVTSTTQCMKHSKL